MNPKKSRDCFGLELELLESDKLSSRITQIRHLGAALPDMQATQAKAEQLCQRLSYLEDELRLVELDDVREAAVLRSVEPERQAQYIDYYEVEVQRQGQTQIQRIRYNRHKNDKENLDFILSERLLERLGKDLQGLG